jgi:hypothetical protein
MERILKSLTEWEMGETNLKSFCIPVFIDRFLTKEKIIDTLSDVYDIEFKDGFVTLVTFTKRVEILQ